MLFRSRDLGRLIGSAVTLRRVADELIYLDHAATTPMRPEALEAMLPFYGERFGNPSGSHRVARDARRAVDEARDSVAGVLGCRPSEVVFTGCGTESDSMALVGTLRRRGGLAVCSSVEHHAVLDVVEHTGGRVVGVDACGRIDLDELAAVLDDSVSVVSVMAVNNEVGSITRMDEVVRTVRRHAPHALLHTDAVQAAGKVPFDVNALKVDLVSISAHKMYGPKGVGALYVRRRNPRVLLAEQTNGGGHERGMRSGTLNVTGIVEIGRAHV